MKKRRAAAAKQIGITIAGLDKLVANARGDVEDESQAPSLYEHWNVVPSDEAIDGDALLAALVDVIRHYVFLSFEQAVVVALWIIFTWVHEVMTHSPILFLTSAEPDSGKSTLLGLVSYLVRRGMSSVEISGPALFRSIKKWQPGLIVDEGDDAFKNGTDLRSAINSGWTRGTGVIRCDPDTNDPHLYSTFAAKALGMKGRDLPDTTLSRSFIIAMKPRRPQNADEHINDFYHVDNDTFARLRAQTMRWAADNADAVAKCEPEIPLAFHNRRRANWICLLKIATVAGGAWPATAFKAAMVIEAVRDTFDPSVGVQLLGTINETFEAKRTDRIRSKELVAALTEDETGLWVAYGKSEKPISETGVSRLLKPYGIRPRTVRFAPGPDGTDKGYLREWFDDAFGRHLNSRVSAVTSAQVNEIKSLDEKPAVTANVLVTGENSPNPLIENDCYDVTAENSISGDKAEDHSCRQCDGTLDGTEQAHQIGAETVWLHPECAGHYKPEVPS